MIEHGEVSEEPGEEGLQILPFRISEIGAYKLERVVDHTGNDVRIYRSEAIVVECPTAEISSFNEYEGHFCQGETDALKINVKGVPPLHVTYTQNVNGHPIVIPIDSIKPESFISPLLQGDANQQLFKTPDYTFAQTHSVTLTYPLPLDTVGVWKYVLTDVRDALGNTIDFEEAPPGYSITVHEKPKVSLRGCSEDNPIKVLKGRDTNLNFNVLSSETGPFHITLGFTGDTKDNPQLETHELGHRRDSLSVTEPGLYTIVNISTKYCSGDVLTPQSCLVITPLEPTLQIEWSTLKDHCSGTVGVTADLTFIGEPPFHLSYRTINKATNQQEVQRLKVDRTRHQMDFKPQVAGTYQYEFIALDDVNYRGLELRGDMFSNEATVHPLPGVKFLNVETRKTCIGSSLNVPLRMIGSGPWNLTYDIVQGGGKRQSFTTRVEQSETILELPEFTRGGKGTVSLRSVTDGGGCKVQLGEQDLVIDVRREKPSAAFYKTSHTGRDGDLVKIPLRLTGDGVFSRPVSLTK
jgi:nucleoporin POM152